MLKHDVQAVLDSYYAEALTAAEPGFIPYFRELSAPFLLSVSQAYLDTHIRVMFIGKETNGWCDKLGAFYERPDGIDIAKTRYEDQHARGTGNSEFLRQWKRFADAFAGGDRAAVCWNNLMKMDWHRPRRGYSRTSIGHSAHLFNFSVAAVQFEIELLKPDLIIFGCGHKYDRALKAVLPKRRAVKVEPKALWHFRSNGIECFRTFHPDAWDRHAPRPIKEYYQEIIDTASKVFAERLPMQNASV
ncbi:uracil-DNA glycosylase family protein [Paraburkholderia rhynchosiae]|uniref:Uracil-DNA glycosylase-like domain-containing protein n=1 Tax=Paraburkholderia rhynchosiae TaxID=487049 RepID=A0A2N7WW23_9BURK|nr:hypothetical protein [Paraburkholderia rhynchosiae]PMS33659.1 hypothetical protein C0Z16_03585 [Paraburkholderia rhynchosiae]CAB3677880.1 hypothetical protein LMG27174_02483 [Paraburkholderia rhynchosiae]